MRFRPGKGNRESYVPSTYFGHPYDRAYGGQKPVMPSVTTPMGGDPDVDYGSVTCGLWPAVG